MKPSLKRRTEIMGATFWRQDYEHRIPRFEVFKCVAHDLTTGTFWFQSVENKTRIGRTFHQLNHNGFHPFCINGGPIEWNLADYNNHVTEENVNQCLLENSNATDVDISSKPSSETQKTFQLNALNAELPDCS